MNHRIREITKGWIPMALIVIAVYAALVVITLALPDVVRFVRSL